MVTFAEPRVVLDRLRAKLLKPPPVLSLSEWADTYRVLGPEESSEPGKWRTDRTPYLKEVMNSISDPDVRSIVVMSSARVGKTSCLSNAIGYFIHQDPAPMLVVYPTVELCKAYSKEQLAPMLRNTPALHGVVAEAKSRDSGNAIQLKVFPGGYIALAGANSPNGLSSRTVRVVLIDETDKVVASAGDFGSPIELAKKRTTTYPGRFKWILMSTPGTKGESAIEDEFNAGDQRRYFITCPHCQVSDYLRWPQVVWPVGKPEEAVYKCPHCSGTWGDAEKPALLAAGRWVPSKVAAIPGTRSYHIWEAYSPWVNFSAMAQAFVTKERQGPESLKTFIQESLGETWDPNAGTDAKAEGLLARARACPHSYGIVPLDAGVLVGSADVQDESIHIAIQAVMPGGRTHVVAHEVIQGNPGQPSTWDRVQGYITQPWRREDGVDMGVAKFCVDSGGHYTKEVMSFVNRRLLAGIIVPTKGSSTAIPGTIKLSKKKSKLVLVDTIQIKDSMYADLRIETVGATGHQSFYSDIDPAFFQELMSERKSKKTRRYEVYPAGSPNEACDLMALCRVALRLYRPQPGEIERLARHYQAQAVGAPVVQVSEPTQAPVAPPMPPRQRPKMRPRIPMLPMGPKKIQGF